MAHACLGGKMDDAIRLLAPNDFFDGGPIGDIDLILREIVTGQQALESRLFQSDLVVVVQIIDADYDISTIKQFVTGEGANKARSTCDEDFHLQTSRDCMLREHAFDVEENVFFFTKLFYTVGAERKKFAMGYRQNGSVV